MNRTIIGILAVFLFLSGTSRAHAQIKIDKKPAPAVGPDEVVVYTWTSSWGLRDDPPNKYPLGIATHKTEAEAVAAAKAHMARTTGNGWLAVTHYLIEGEPSVRNKMADRTEKAEELLDRVKEAKKAVDEAKKVAKGEEPLLKASERKLGDTIKEYKGMVEKSLGQVTEVKKTLTGGVASLTDAKFREVNGLIDQYNREVQGFQAVMGKNAKLGYSPLARVSASPPPAPQPEKKLCYICWYGDMATYGGQTREEAISGGRKSKQLNPSLHIRVTEHSASASMTIDAISKTAGKTILDLP